MKFKDLKQGQWFMINCRCNTQSSCVKYMKIYPIEDKWGSCFVAVDDKGYLIDTEDIDADTEIFAEEPL